ncbi:TerB N-terminal domain-containing protein [candidate division KSB1 bacterium]
MDSIVFLVVILLFILILIYFVKGSKKHLEINPETEIKTARVENQATGTDIVRHDAVSYKNKIPERTRKLLWLSDKPPSIFDYIPGIIITITPDGIESVEKELEDMSTININLPIQIPSSNIEVPPLPYWPKYIEMDPSQRWNYLNWLCDNSKPIDIGYVFVYYYGLERHLVMGHFENAFEEILFLMKHHHHKSFITYATDALFVSGFNRDRPDLIDKIPYDPENVNYDILLLYKVIKELRLLPEEMMAMSSKVGFTNKRYIKKHPERFINILSSKLKNNELKEGKHILEKIKWEKSPQRNIVTYANITLPPEIRTPSIPSITEEPAFKKIVFNLLSETHEQLKSELAQERKAKGI